MTETDPTMRQRLAAPSSAPLAAAVALLLFIAAALKLSDYLQGAVQAYPQAYVAEIIFELVLATALISGVARRAILWLTAGVFLIFMAVTLHRALEGRHSCGCFGSVKVNPWITFALDVAIFISIAISLRHFPSAASSGRRRVPIFLLTLVAVLLCAAALTWFYRPGQLYPSGQLTGGHGPITMNPPNWYGKRLPLLRFIRSSHLLAKGTWLVVVYFHDCPDCQAEIRQIHRHLQARARRALAAVVPHVALVQLPPFGPLPPTVSTAAMVRLKMKSSRRWLPPFLPVLIQIHNGVVRRVGTHLRGHWFGFDLHRPGAAATDPAGHPMKNSPSRAVSVGGAGG